MNALSPDQTHQQLNEAAERQQLSRIDATVGAVFSGGIAVLVAATDLGDHLAREPVGFAISMGVHAVALAAFRMLRG